MKTLSLLLAIAFMAPLSGVVLAHTHEGRRQIVTAFGAAGCRHKAITQKKKDECLACVSQGAAYHYHPYEPEGKRCHRASEGR